MARNRDELTTLIAVGRPATVEDGGSARLAAIADAVEAAGGTVLDLVAVAPGRPLAIKAATALYVLLRELVLGRNGTVHIEYPGFPSIGVYYRSPSPSPAERLPRAVAYHLATLAVALIGAACRARRRRFVVGIGDLPSMELDLPDRGRMASRRLTERYERRLLATADAVWVVTPEERDVLVRAYGADPSLFVIVPNGNPRVPLPVRASHDGPVQVVYAGSLYRDRDNLVEAIQAALDQARRPLTVTLAGPGGEWVEPTFADHRVRWLGTISQRECFDLVSASDVGILVYFDDEPYYAIAHPTKLSLYLAATIPIASGNARYIERFVREHGVGVAVPRSAFPAALVRLIDDAGRRREMSERAAAIRDDFFWDAILQKAFADTRAITRR